MKFRKKPVVIEAIQFTDNNRFEIAEWAVQKNGARSIELGQDYIRISTLEGTMTASFGDWIIKGVAGEFYPCKPDIFEQTYEQVIETPTPEELTEKNLEVMNSFSKANETLRKIGLQSKIRPGYFDGE